MSASLFNENQIKAIELLAEGGKTYIEVAELVGVSVETLRLWRMKEEFQDQVRKRCRELLREREPDLYDLALKAARKNQSHQHIKILLDRIERLEDIAEGRNTDNTFLVKWGGKDK